MRDQTDMGDAASGMAGTAEGAATAADMERKIARERADLLYASRLPMAVALVLAVALSVLMWQDLPSWAILGWLALIAIAALLRWRLRRAYLASDREPPALWLHRFAWHVPAF